MKLCNPCAAVTVENHGKADLTRTGAMMEYGQECQRCGRRNRPVIEYEITPRKEELYL